MKYIKKLFLKSTLITSLFLAVCFACLKVFGIKHDREFIEPMSIFTSLLGVVIFVYGFILSPTIAEYKESEKLVRDIKIGLENIMYDLLYIFQLDKKINIQPLLFTLSQMTHQFYEEIAENKNHTTSITTGDVLFISCVSLEQSGVPVGHIVRIKQELSMVKKSMIRCLEVKRKDSLPRVIHNLKNFITFLVLLTLLFLDMGEKVALFDKLQQGIMLFLLSFLYVYLSAIIKSLDDPFDKRNFSGYLDINCIRQTDLLMQTYIQKNR